MYLKDMYTNMVKNAIFVVYLSVITLNYVCLLKLREL